MIADVCKKTCGKCKDISTGTSTTEETINVEETSSTETPTTVAGIFFILQNHTLGKNRTTFNLVTIYYLYISSMK